MSTLWDHVSFNGLRSDLDHIRNDLGRPSSNIVSINRLINLSALFDATYPPGSIIHVGLLETKFPYEVKSGSYVLLDASNIKVLVKDKHFPSREDVEISIFDMEEFSDLWKAFTKPKTNFVDSFYSSKGK
jgi:hypothetical protein